METHPLTLPALMLGLVVCLAATAGLAAEDECEGWKSLFNGEDYSGWQPVGGHMDDWSVEDGEMVLAGRSDDGARWLATEQQYSNYELKLDFKLSEGGNSGVFIRTPLEGHPSRDGIEVQLLDDYADKHADLRSWQYSGSVYGIKGPETRVSKQPGEWQSIHIYLNNGHCKVTMNGELIVDVDFDDYLDQADEWGGLVRRVGHIGLQSYGDRLRFRNIKVRPLD